MNVQSLTICSVNAQSCRNKTNAIRDYIVENDIDVCAITESWITSEDDAIMAEITPVGYNLLAFHCDGRSGRGILILHSKNIKSDLIRKGETKSFE